MDEGPLLFSSFPRRHFPIFLKKEGEKTKIDLISFSFKAPPPPPPLINDRCSHNLFFQGKKIQQQLKDSFTRFFCLSRRGRRGKKRRRKYITKTRLPPSFSFSFCSPPFSPRSFIFLHGHMWWYEMRKEEEEGASHRSHLRCKQTPMQCNARSPKTMNSFKDSRGGIRHK